MRSESGSVERLLDDIRQRLTKGDLSSLPELNANLAQEMERLQPEGAAQAQRIRAMALRNLACLDAASRGIRAARRRLEEVRQTVSGTIVSYDGQGRRAETLPEAQPRQRL